MSLFDDQSGEDSNEEGFDEEEGLSNTKYKKFIADQRESDKRIKEWEKRSSKPKKKNVQKNQTKVIICPICKEFGDFKTTPMEVLSFGFTMEAGPENSMYAPHGICVGRCIEENKSFGTALIIEGTQQRFQLNQLWEKEQKLKTTYANSMGSVDILILHPPYSGFKEALSTINWGELDEDARKEEVNKSSKEKDPLDWFDNLGKDLVELENIYSKWDKPTMNYRLRLFIVSFLHKSVTFKHIETMWMFSKRFQIGIRGIEVLFKRWPSEQPAFAAKYLQKLCEVKPTRSSIESLLSNAKRMGTFELTRGDEEYLIDQACQLLTKIEKLKSTSGTSMMENCIKAAKHNEKTSLSGESWPVVGLIEALILKSVVEKAYKGQKIKKDLAISISETLFPLPMNGVPLWKWMLEDGHAEKLVEKWDILAN